MKNYVSPEMELVVVSITDVITTSFEEVAKLAMEFEYDSKSIFN